MTLQQAAERLVSGDGQRVTLKVFGHSMEPRIHHGATVTLDGSRRPQPGDVVLAKVRGRYVLHLIKAIVQKPGGWEFLITNNRGRVNGWAKADKVYGIVVAVE